MPTSRPKAVRKPTYWYRCCAKSDIDQTLEAGQIFDLHWMAETELPLPIPTGRYVILAADLVGPYLDPFLNIADGDVHTVAAPDVTADLWEAETPVSSFALPADLPPGVYQLRTTTLLDPETRGASSAGMTVVRIGRPAS
jgi:hypothetical protein